MVVNQVVDILMQGNGWTTLAEMRGRVYTQTQQQQLEEIKQAFIKALAAELKNLVDHPQRFSLSNRILTVKYISASLTKGTKAYFLDLEVSGLFAGYLKEDHRLLTTDEDYRFAIEQTNIEAADIKKALVALTLDFGELIVSRNKEEKNESAI